MGRDILVTSKSTLNYGTSVQYQRVAPASGPIPTRRASASGSVTDVARARTISPLTVARSG